MLQLVVKHLIAQRSERGAPGGRVDRRIVDLGDDLGSDKDGDRRFQAADQVVQTTKHPVRERRLRKAHTVERQQTPQLTAVALLFGNEEPNGLR
jgi:hypothetical protein